MEQENIIFGNIQQSIRIVSRASNPVPHSHYEAEVIYCIKGKTNITIEGVEYHLEKGCAVIIAPLTTYKNIPENSENETTEMFVIKFDSKFLGSSYYEFASYTFENPLLSPENIHDCHILKAIEKLHCEYINKDNGYNWMIHGLLCEIFALIVRHMPKRKRNENGNHVFKNHIRILKVFDLVNKEYSKNLTVKEAAECAGYDPCAFCRIFKSVTGITFHNYLNTHRLNVATRLLSSGTYSVGEVAQMVGIPVSKTFSRLFKKHTGKSPTQYTRNKNYI